MKRETTLGFLLTLVPAVANVYLTRPEPDSKQRPLVVEVREAGTSCALPGALVRVEGIKRDRLTDSLGLAHFAAGVRLSHVVVAALPGYDSGTGRPWLAAGGITRARLELMPTFPRAVTGKVTDGTGMPLSGARVWIADDTSITDSVGHFALKRSHASPLDLQVSHPGLPCCCRDIRLAGHDSVIVNAALYDSTARGGVVGRVYDGWKGGPVVGACLTIEGTDWGIPTDINGDYAFHNLPPGDYTVVCSPWGADHLKSRVSVKPNRSARCDFHPCGVY